MQKAQHGSICIGQCDSAADQYPTVPSCNDCVEQDGKARESSQIVSEHDYDESYEDTCDWCGNTTDEEDGAA